jgi:hypothetical protein
MSNAYDNASLLVTPNGYEAGTIFSAKPTDGSGDLTFSRASTALRRNSAGLWEEVANNVPRLHYPVGGGCPSWLLEPQRENLITRSYQAATGWTGVSASATNDTTTSPTGAVNASTINLSSGGYWRFLGFSVSELTIYTMSALVKNNGLSAGQTYKFYMNNNNGVGPLTISGTVDIVNGTFSLNSSVGVTSPSASIEAYGNGWYRIILSFTSIAGRASANAEIGFDGINIASGSLYMWGAQVEAGGFATSPIITTGARVTRSADYFTLNQGGSSSGGTWFIHLKNNTPVLSDAASSAPYVGSSSASGVAGWSFVLRQGGGAQRVALWKYESGVGTSLYTTLTDEVKIAVTWNGVTADVWVNGVRVVAGTAFATSVLQYLASGNSGTLGRPIFIVEQQIYPSQITDLEAESLTTL